MNFRNLPKNIQEGIRELTTDEEFQNRFATDKVLDEIDAMKTNVADEYKCLQLVIGNKIKINEKLFSALTPSMWSFLWVIDSPFVNYEKDVKAPDIDLFFYILENGIGDGDSVRIISDSLQYTPNHLKMTYDEGLSIITSIIKISFKPLNLFPKTNASGGRNEFDADWLTSLVAKVHQVTGYLPDYIMNEMSLTSACYYFAQYRRMNGADNIFKRTPEEILILEDRRACEMIIERLIEKKVISENEKEKWFKEITTSPKNK